MLQTLETEKWGMYPGEIAVELDKSHQLVGKYGNTCGRWLVSRNLCDQGRLVFETTPLKSTSKL